MKKYIGTINACEALDKCGDTMLDIFDVKDLILNGEGVYLTAREEMNPDTYGEDNVSDAGGGYLVCEYYVSGETYFDLFQVITTDRNGNEIEVGSKVVWFDPDESARNTERVWKVYEVNEEMVCIADDFSEAEVLPNELEVIDNIPSVLLQELTELMSMTYSVLGDDGGNTTAHDTINKAADMCAEHYTELPICLRGVFEKCVNYINKDFESPMALEDYIAYGGELVEDLGGSLAAYFCD